jgi:hypothetical protein
MTAYRDRLEAGEYDPKRKGKDSAKKAKSAESKRAARSTTTKSTKGLR